MLTADKAEPRTVIIELQEVAQQSHLLVVGEGQAAWDCCKVCLLGQPTEARLLTDALHGFSPAG